MGFRSFCFALTLCVIHIARISGRITVGSLHFIPPVCDTSNPPACDENQKFRTVDGTCNNLAYPLWGSSGIPLVRMAPQAYKDSKSIPRGGFLSALDHDEDKLPFKLTRNVSSCSTNPNRPLPNPRQVSTEVHKTTKRNQDKLHSHMLTHFGQFLSHDTDWTPELPLPDPDCCGNRGGEDPKMDGVCFPVFPPSNDERSQNDGGMHKCWNFRRSVHCGGEGEVREQANLITAFVDASMVYGSESVTAGFLRTFQDGLMKHDSGDVRLLPKLTNGVLDVFVAGDERAREVPGLTSMHTLLLLEHNRIATGLKATGTASNDETLYQVARRILIAELQNIAFGDYLRQILGDEYDTFHLDPSESSEYDPDVNPSIANVFSTAAFRFGHSMIPGFVDLRDKTTGERKPSEAYTIADNFKDPLAVKVNSEFENILYTMTRQPSHKNDLKFHNDVRNLLFENVDKRTGRLANMTMAVEMPDLPARNIQRGREHGLPGYNAFREICGLPKSCSWEDVPEGMTKKNWDLLSNVYHRPGDIDIFSGAMAERRVKNGVTGPTFTCILGRQFSNLRKGDRFFFTHTEESGNPNGFNDDKLANLRSRRLADILCDNLPIQATFKENVFKLKNVADFNCTQTSAIDFSLFSQELLIP